MLPPNPTSAPHGGGVWREDLALERIAALLSPAPAGHPGAVSGDDTAILEQLRGRLLFCTDAGVAGIHLDTTCLPIYDLGYRTAIAALSDVAAMGGTAVAAVVAICAPGDVDVLEIERGAIEACRASNCTVVGGDLSKAESASVVVSVLGKEDGSPSVPRSGATAGDVLFVTGPLGASALGLRRRREGAELDDPVVLMHRRPVARVTEGRVAARGGATAMIDLSDGLARDVRRLADASGVGVELEAVPLADGATRDEGLGGGEDYELLIAHPSRAALDAAFFDAGLRPPIAIGVVVADGAVLTVDGDALPDVGWRH